MTKEQLQAIVDGIFAFAEAKLGSHQAVVMILEFVRRAIDGPGIDALLAYLQQRGAVAPKE